MNAMFLAFLVIMLFASNALAAQTAEPSSKEACDKAGGRWGKFGMAQTEGCDLPTKDAGKACEKNSDCETICVDDASVPPFMPRKGKCFDRSKVFGCHKIYTKNQPNGAQMQACFD